MMIDFARVFAQGKLEAYVFAEAYAWLYIIMKRTDELQSLDRNSVEAVTILSGLADMYSGDADRLPSELSDTELFEKVCRTLELYDQKQLGNFSESTVI